MQLSSDDLYRALQSLDNETYRGLSEVLTAKQDVLPTDLVTAWQRYNGI